MRATTRGVLVLGFLAWPALGPAPAQTAGAPAASPAAAVPAPAQTAGMEDAAQKVAEAWLALVDEGKFAESWDEASAYARRVVPKELWMQAEQGGRQPLGRVIARKLKSRTYREQLPGAPDGKYVVILYDTTFENKKDALETITPTLDGDRWRVSGYWVR
jgi:hypothetical protein